MSEVEKELVIRNAFLEKEITVLRIEKEKLNDERKYLMDIIDILINKTKENK